MRSARIVVGDPTWWWKALVLAAAGFVPIIGGVFVLGFQMILMRDVAWGVNRGLPRFGEIEEIARSGFSGFVAAMVWSLILVPFVIVAIIALFFTEFARIAASGPSSAYATPWWFILSVGVLTVGVNVLAMVAVLRVAIYTKISAGLSFSAVTDLITRARPGFWRVTGLMVSISLLGLVLSTPALLAKEYAHLTLIPSLAVTYGGGFVVRSLLAFMHLLVMCAYGLWAQETDPSTWPPLGAPAQRV